MLRVLEVVTRMCDNVIAYIDADRVERRLMLDTLGEVTRSFGAAMVASPPGVTAPGERLIGGSMDPGPEAVVDVDLPAFIEQHAGSIQFAHVRRQLGVTVQLARVSLGSRVGSGTRQSQGDPTDERATGSTASAPARGAFEVIPSSRPV